MTFKKKSLRYLSIFGSYSDFSPSPPNLRHVTCFDLKKNVLVLFERNIFLDMRTLYQYINVNIYVMLVEDFVAAVEDELGWLSASSARRDRRGWAVAGQSRSI